MVKAFTSRVEDPEFDSRLCREDFYGSSHTSDLKLGTPVAIMPGAWHYRVSAGWVWPCVSNTNNNNNDFISIALFHA